MDCGWNRILNNVGRGWKSVPGAADDCEPVVGIRAWYRRLGESKDKWKVMRLM